MCSEVSHQLHEDGEAMMIFRVGGLWAALPAHNVAALHSPIPPTLVPLAPDYVPGIASFRGEVVPLLDVAKFLEVAERDPAQSARGARFDRVAIVEAAKMRVGLLLHEVRGVVPVSRESRRALQATRGRRIEAVATGELSHGDDVVVILDAAKLLNAARVKA
jgi:chemotaxis signal transduction protein